MKVGCHVSIEGGVSRAVREAKLLGNTAFAMWLHSNRGWTSKPYTPEEIERFKTECKTHNYNARTDILPHGSYLINLGSPDPEKQNKSYNAFVDELKRCEQLGIGLYNFHPGSSVGTPKPPALDRVAKSINEAHSVTEYVKVVLENSAGDPAKAIGSQLTDLKTIIDMVDDKDRVGVCIDTCHTYAAGWDLKSEKGFSDFWKEFDKVVGMKYLSAIHVNDSCWPMGSHRDQHARVGTGFLGPQAFRILMNSPELENVVAVLETKEFEDEVPQLKWFIGKTEEEVEKNCQGLIDKGKSMRETNQRKIDEKAAKEAKKGASKRKAPSQAKTMADFVVKRKKTTEKPEAQHTGQDNTSQDTSN